MILLEGIDLLFILGSGCSSMSLSLSSNYADCLRKISPLTSSDLLPVHNRLTPSEWARTGLARCALEIYAKNKNGDCAPSHGSINRGKNGVASGNRHERKMS